MDEILDAIKHSMEEISDIYPDYPCDRCQKCSASCTAWQDCPRWRGWFDRIWMVMRQNYGKENRK